jgi:hypothetical protein
MQEGSCNLLFIRVNPYDPHNLCDYSFFAARTS